MNNKIESLNNELVESINLLMEDYKNLIVNYEDSRQLYQKTIDAYETNYQSATVIYCNRIVGYTPQATISNWSLLLLDGSQIYSSDNYVKVQTWILDLSTLKIEPGTKFNLKITHGNGVYFISDKTLIYTPDSNATVYYGGYISHLQYFGVSPLFYTPNAAPYLKCKKLHITNDSTTLSKFGFFTLDGKQFYETDRTSKGDTLSINLEDLKIVGGTLQEGAVFKVKALVITGVDSTCDITVQYMSDSLYAANLRLDGPTSITMLMFMGAESLIPPPPRTINVNSIMVYNISNMIVRFSLILLDGTVVYVSKQKLQAQNQFINSSNINLPPGTQLRLKAIIPSDDIGFNILLKYVPESLRTAYVNFSGEAASPATKKFDYLGRLSSETMPPLIKCASLLADIKGPMLSKWSLVKNGETLYQSDRFTTANTLKLDFSKTKVLPGTRFFLKANVIAGEDSTAYVTIEYDPTSTIIPIFALYGATVENIVAYQGLY